MQILPETFAKFTRVKVSDSVYGEPGWSLLAILEDEEVITEGERQDPESSWRKIKYDLPTPIIRKKHLYVLGQTLDDTLAQLTDENTRLSNDRYKEQQAAATFKVDLEAAQKSLISEKARADDADAKLTEAKANVDRWAAANTNLERDIAKIRRELGEDRMRRILS